MESCLNFVVGLAIGTITVCLIMPGLKVVALLLEACRFNLIIEWLVGAMLICIVLALLFSFPLSMLSFFDDPSMYAKGLAVGLTFGWLVYAAWLRYRDKPN